MPSAEPAPAPSRTVAIVTLGCGRNEVDSQNAAGLLAASGYRVVADPEQADAVVVNTCAFVEAAKRESIETVLDAAALKERGRARTVLVTGCLAERYTEELRAELPEADAIVPFADYGRLPELLGGPPVGHGSPNGSGPSNGSATSAQPTLVPVGRRALPMVFPTPAGAAFPARAAARGPVALVKLAEGCDRDCSFCAIPSFRGRFRSRRPTEILDEVAWLAAQGVSEVCLVAENSTSYGKDLGGREALIHLLSDLATVDGLRRVRLNYLQPDELTPGLLEEMAANPVVCSYFDLSLQHASAPVLRRMRRGGSAEGFLDLVGRIRALDPDAALRSNFILGFPGEREADVAELEEFLEAARLDWVAFFAWSPEDGTAALDLDNRVPAATAEARVERVQELQDRLLAEAQDLWVGRPLEVLVERVEDDGTAEGRSFREAPDADGVVRVADATAARTVRVGEYLPVVVTAAQGPELLARLAG
ncbi:MAG TPA: 30S ribosomal protein S12 methylthiotransferase RimO [Actinomycetes bacterium]|nr:30S ribosomal protein S12 methylthiotransferase RimO [Actinomycetes bacterium]